MSAAKPWLAMFAIVALVALMGFSMWAEWGPYEWFSRAQVAVLGNYYLKITFLLTALLFIAPATPLFKYLKSDEAHKKPFAIGIVLVALPVLAHFGLSIYFVATNGAPAKAATFTESIKSPCFMPRNVSMTQTPFDGLDTDNAITLTQDNKSGGYVYIPFKPEFWPHPDQPVVTRFKSEFLSSKIVATKLDGTVRIAPLPFLVRDQNVTQGHMMVVLFENGETVRELWLLPMIMYIIFSIVGIVRLVQYVRNKPAGGAVDNDVVFGRRNNAL